LGKLAGTGTCEVCGKHVQFGHNVSHAKNRTARQWAPNIQTTRLAVNGTYRQVRICTRCLRTLSKTQK
jgi:large subunit ribosomal protein L28